jgi:hypothetical protein
MVTSSGSVCVGAMVTVSLLLLESAELERDRINSGRKRREDVVAVAGSCGGENALTIRRGGIHGDARQHEPLGVDHLP